MSSSNSTTSTNSPTESSAPTWPVQTTQADRHNGDIDFEKALQKKPPRWTYQGQLEANRQREAAQPQQSSISAKDGLEQAKMELLGLKRDMDSIKNGRTGA